VNLRQFLSSQVRWGECDLRRDPRRRLVLGHDSFEETTWIRDESSLTLASAVEAFAEHGRALKVDLKDGADILHEVLLVLDQHRFGDHVLWFKAPFDVLGADGFRDVLTGRIGDWWNEPYVPPSSRGISLDLRPGGVLWDDRGNGNGYALGVVRGFTQPRELILDGDFGVPGAIHGRLVVTLDETPPGSTITFTHTAIGAIPDDREAHHRDGWADLLARLCALAAPTKP
jgi:Activator of Hsp90 ATPase homolog 1-like protein